MKGQNQSTVDIALIHHPVAGKNGEVIGSAVTNLDIHDIARIARTYGIGRFYIVTPYEDQQKLVAEIIEHWQSGHGSTANPARKMAFEIVRVVESLDKVIEAILSRTGQQPSLAATSAQTEGSLSYHQARQRIEGGERTVLLFGTAHGLTQESVERAEYILPAITTRHGYNHLSVRAAVAVICDRLFGDWE